MNEKISSVLKSVEKPGRYSGGEYGQVIKNKADVKARFAFAFPDTYEIGMSNLGMRILYGSLNKESEIWCERVFAPWTDMQQKMQELDIPLFAHESGDPVSEFDILGFTLQYEMCYTTVLRMLKLARIPLRAKDRAEGVTIEELTQLCSWLGLYDAMNLDGGGSSALWSRKYGVVSHPCDNHKYDHEGERKVSSTIVVKTKK
jgi:hypothetical protein